MVTYSISRNPDYNDIDLSFTKNRRTGDVRSVLGVDAVVNSIKNLINLNFYEKPFRPSIGSNVHRLLFENINHLTSTFILNAIAEVIVNYEPRATLIEVIVDPDPENNRYNITIVVGINNVSTPVKIDTFLSRLR